MNNEPVWTEWLENPGTGDNPVPEFAVGVEMILADGEAEDCEPKSCFWGSDAMLPITHYRYQVPSDLAWLANRVYKWSAPKHFRIWKTGPPWIAAFWYEKPESCEADGYTKSQWLRARRDLWYGDKAYGLSREELENHQVSEDGSKMQAHGYFDVEGDFHIRTKDNPSAHYQGYQYKGIKLDPYRIARIYNMQGGPREQIMKKCLRFSDKGQTEREVVSEIRSALDRWEEMLEEDSK